jgi:hypothetical protein
MEVPSLRSSFLAVFFTLTQRNESAKMTVEGAPNLEVAHLQLYQFRINTFVFH